MKNRVAIITTAIALVALMIVGATLAWFTGTDTATNAVTMGNLGIKVVEKDGKLIDEVYGIVFDDVVPGDKPEKDPAVKNTGSVDSYIRAQIVFTPDEEFEFSSVATANWADFQETVLAQIDAKVDDWVLVGGYYYYVGLSDTDAIAGVLASGKITATLFDNIEFPSSWGNEMAGFSFKIDIVADGLQVKNLEIEDDIRANLDSAGLAAAIAAIFDAEY